MYFDVERAMQLLTALLVGGFYYFVLIPRLKNITWLLVLTVVWIAGFILMRDTFTQLILILNDGIYPLSFEQYIIVGQDAFLALLIFTVGQLKFVNDES
ncbi:MAG: hypothetical protein KAT25_01155 [Sulfuriflexus sp.]|nr:hypothetical protein [Sulfuriflexus sp.]